MAPDPVRLLLVDVPSDRAGACLGALEDAGWAVRAEAADGPDELEAALLRRGWDAVLHGGEAARRVPATKAVALVRLADAHLPVVTVDPTLRDGDVTGVLRAAGRDTAVAGPSQLPERLAQELAGAAERRGAGGGHRLLAAQQGVADHLAAGPAPAELLRRVLGTLGETFGFVYGAVWQPDPAGAVLRCDVVWHAAGADARVTGFGSLSRSWTFAPGRGLPGRVWAFHRPVWMADHAQSSAAARGEFAAHAGLVGALAFPIAADDELVAVAELWATERREPDPEVAVLLGAVGRQLGAALARRDREDAERRRLELLLAAAAGRAA